MTFAINSYDGESSGTSDEDIIHHLRDMVERADARG